MSKLSHTVILLLLVQIISSVLTALGRKGATSGALKRDKLIIGPVADCRGPLVDLGTEIRLCYAKCEGYPKPNRGVRIRIHHSLGTGPRIVECRKLKLTQRFTQFWTFSTERGPIVKEHLTPDVAECLSKWQSECKEGDCNLREPDHLEEEYHYASDTDVTAEFVTLYSTDSLLILKNGEERVAPMGADADFPMDTRKVLHSNVVYMWDPNPPLKECPYKVAGEYGCDQYDEGDDTFYTCSKGGMTITPTKTPDMHPRLCPAVRVSEEGLIYSVDVAASPKEDDYGRVAIDVPDGTVEAADSMYLRQKIQILAKTLESDICYTQCEVMSLEVRMSNKTEHLVRVGHNHLLAFENGTALQCQAITGCQLSTPATYCGNPPRLGLVCSQVHRLWEPMTPYLKPDQKCEKPRGVEHLSFSMGTSVYDVDDQLEINVTKTDLANIYHSEFLRYHSGNLNLKTKDLDSLKDGWMKSKEGKSKSTSSSKTSRTVDSPHIGLGEAALSVFKTMFSVVDSVEEVIGIAVIAVVAVMTVVLIKNIWGLKRSPTRRRRRRVESAGEEELALNSQINSEPTWI
ncbi:putative glycoprotein [Hyptis latent virus]|uniref:Glycoprotein n=1 Tax=Hyptis latent virus TaxID=2963947 RepID=A0AAE9MR32_9RHAB|nr:putative glycoprotein [Hyptis latent virus]